MTTDEVILRREKAAASGEPFVEPPPRLRGQSTYLALLSSLATDLDIMLNDLRSSPSSRLLPPTHHLHQRHASNSSSPLTIGAGTPHFATGHTSSTGYLHSALRSNQPHHHAALQQPHSVQIISNQTAAAAQSAAAAAASAPVQLHYNRSANYCSSSSAAIRYQNQNPNHSPQRLNQDAHKLRARHTNAVATSSNSSSSSSSSSHANGNDVAAGYVAANADGPAAPPLGLSPDVRQIQKLPLWSYQHKQLQQPQRLHVQMLQQQKQQAMKAIAARATGRQQAAVSGATFGSAGGGGGVGDCMASSTLTATRTETSTATLPTTPTATTTTSTTTTTTTTMTTTCLMTNSMAYKCGRSENCSKMNSGYWLQSSRNCTHFFG